MNVLELILEKLDDRKTRMVDDIATGNRSFDEYKYNIAILDYAGMAIVTCQNTH